MNTPAGDLQILQSEQLDLGAAELGEGPHWDAETGSLYWVDIPAGLVHRLGSDGVHTTWPVGQPAGAVVPRSSGGLLVAAGSGFVTLDIETGVVTPLVPAEHGKPGNRMNDGACDRAGRMFAGTMAFDESPHQGALYRLDPDHSVRQVLSEVGISNGIGWSPDDTLMYYIDSHTYRIDVFDYDLATGELANRRPFAQVGGGEASPDGLTVDSEGGVWAALWGGYAIHRYDPAGDLAAVIELPAGYVTSCAFGGPDLDQLFITTAAGPGDGSGSLFTCRPGVAGTGGFAYGG